MPLRNSAERYGSVAQLLHWAVVVLIIVQFALASAAEDLPTGMEKLITMARHKSFGITILALAALRLAWRLVDPPPPLPAGMHPLQHTAARVSHGLLYGLLFALPLSGWMQSSAANYPVSWFGLAQLPDLVAPSKSLHDALHEVHEALAATLIVIAVVHVLAALKHQFMDRDGVLMRMLPGHRK
jgi:cytochrome b561